MLAGLLVGFEGRRERNLSHSLRRTLESATVKAVNLALQEGEASNEFAANSMAIMLSYVFDLLSDGEKMSLNDDLLLPILVQAPFFTKEGLHSGYFLSTIDADVVQSAERKFDWSARVIYIYAVSTHGHWPHGCVSRVVVTPDSFLGGECAGCGSAVYDGQGFVDIYEVLVHSVAAE